jgi:hypothetical protein
VGCIGLAVDPAGIPLASISHNTSLWRLSRRQTIPIFQESSLCVTFSVDGKHIFSGDNSPVYFLLLRHLISRKGVLPQDLPDNKLIERDWQSRFDLGRMFMLAVSPCNGTREWAKESYGACEKYQS